MPFRESFACLWCGRAWTVRGPDDLEGFAQLCPDCLGRAGENPFLRFRLRAALGERGAARGTSAGEAEEPGEPGEAGSTAAGGRDDDFFLRRGPHDLGPIGNATWAADLDAAGLWLEALPLSGRIVEIPAGNGWWSPLLASKGELRAYDPDGAALDGARDRLLAHGLRAHLHVRDPWGDPDEPADALVSTFWLGRLPAARRPAWLALARRWLLPGGLVALVDAVADVAPDRLRDALGEAGFAEIEVDASGTHLVRARATAA